MKVTAEEVALAGQALTAVAGVWDPKNAAALALLLQAGLQVNTLIQRVRAQTEADEAQVWEAVRGDFRASVDAFAASLK